jgi:hypothetical protein
MITITAIKNNKFYYGSPNAIASLLTVTGEQVRNWIRQGYEIKSNNGYIIYLNGEKLPKK